MSEVFNILDHTMYHARHLDESGVVYHSPITYKTNIIMYTTKEKADIESWREGEAIKFQCIWYQKFKNRWLKANNQKELKPDCFCSIQSRRPYKINFYIWWDGIKNTL